jgi:lipopolysaccharide transport system ATP-binding protein
MYVRLAFAVAAHLEPEILIVDEVLAVGDAQFQKKCLGKMEEVGKQGRTVSFVSHNMGAIRTLCQKCILLNNGQIILDNETDKVLNHYAGDRTNCSYYSAAAEVADKPYIYEVQIIQNNENKSIVAIDKNFKVVFKIEKYNAKI